MLFNSFEFIFFFLPLTFLIYFGLNKTKKCTLAKVWLALASLFFYGWWNVSNLPILLSSISFNFLCGSYITKSPKPRLRKLALLVGITFNLGLLGYYKYSNFFISTVNQISGAKLDLIQIVLPLGISFFTFTQIAYLVDSYKNIAKEYNLNNYILFITFFPHLMLPPK